MSLIDGTASGSVVTIGGHALSLEHSAPGAGGKVTVGIRPEGWRIVSQAADGIPVDVSLVEELGADGFAYGTTMSPGCGTGHADESKERRALKAVAITFFVLAAYVTIEGIRALLGEDEPDSSTVGLVLLAASVVVMPLLARAKRRVGAQLGGDQLILADAAETKICVMLSVSTLLGLGLYALTGAAWLDPVAGFVIAAFSVHAGREAWEGELVEDDD